MTRWPISPPAEVLYEIHRKTHPNSAHGPNWEADQRQWERDFRGRVAERLASNPGQLNQAIIDELRNSAQAGGPVPAKNPATTKEGTSMAKGTPESTGLKPTPGGVATIDGVKYYSDGETWQTTPFPPKPATDLGRIMLGFDPQYQAPVDHFTEPGGSPSGPARLSAHHYATKETADRLAQLLGATVVEVEGVAVDSGSVQYELEFAGAAPGKERHNAGLVAHSIMTQPKTALTQLAFDIGFPRPITDQLPDWYKTQNMGLTSVPLADRKAALDKVASLISELNKA